MDSSASDAEKGIAKASLIESVNSAFGVLLDTETLDEQFFKLFEGWVNGAEENFEELSKYFVESFNFNEIIGGDELQEIIEQLFNTDIEIGASIDLTNNGLLEGVKLT
jgi:hypothetical protein